MFVLRALIGLAFFCAVAWLLSSNRRRFPTRVVGFGLGMQLLLAAFLLRTDVGLALFQGAADFVTKLISMTAGGTSLVFGNLSQGNFAPGGWGYAFAFASSGLTVIIFFSAIMAVLYHLGVMQVLIYGLARVMTALLGVSGAESMAMAANVFVGQTEAPLVVKPYIEAMTRSELNALMTGGFATIAGSVLAVYMGLLGEEYGPHLLTASVMSAPAAFVLAKIMLPETEESATGSKVELRIERTADNVIEAAAMGTADGVKLWLNVVAMLIAFMGLVALVDWPLTSFGDWLGDRGFLEGGLSLGRIFGWIFAPVAWCIGIEGWGDCQLMGTLLGTKIAVNEFIAFDTLQDLLPTAGAEGGFQSTRSAQMGAYALCGFANFASIGIQLGGIGPLAPSRRKDLSRFALRAMLGGAFASWMTATVAGVFLNEERVVLETWSAKAAAEDRSVTGWLEDAELPEAEGTHRLPGFVIEAQHLPSDGPVAARLTSFFALEGDARVGVTLPEGLAGRVTVDGSPHGSPTVLPAGRHALEVRLFLDGKPAPPLEVRVEIQGIEAEETNREFYTR